MIDKRLFPALAMLLPLAACGQEAPADDSRAASGEVLEGTISDAMLPLDRVTSEPPLEDPEAFAEAQEKAADNAPAAATDPAAGEADDAAPAEDEPAAEPAPEAED